MENTKSRIMIVDDDPHAIEILTRMLGREGYECVSASSGKAALETVRGKPVDVILLDVMMPEMDGLEFLRRYREDCHTPVILLTARVDESDKVVGLELGADDYVTKPFSPRELIARVRAVLRRHGQNEPETTPLQVQDVVLDQVFHTVEVGGQSIDLTPSEFDLLAALMTAPGRVFTRMELLDRAQGTAHGGCERTVDVHVKNMRTKIEPVPKNPRYIETVYGVGYRFTSSDS